MKKIMSNILIGVLLAMSLTLNVFAGETDKLPEKSS